MTTVYHIDGKEVTEDEILERVRTKRRSRRQEAERVKAQRVKSRQAVVRRLKNASKRLSTLATVYDATSDKQALDVELREVVMRLTGIYFL